MWHSVMGTGIPPTPPPNLLPMVDFSTLLRYHSSNSVEALSLEVFLKHKVQCLIILVGSTISWWDHLWSASKIAFQSIKSPNITSTTIYNVMALIDMVLINSMLIGKYWFFSFFKDLFFIFIGKSDLQSEGDTERKIFNLLVHCPIGHNS